MPSHRHHDHGDLYISFDVIMPEKGWTNDPNNFEALRKALPLPTLPKVPTEAMTEPLRGGAANNTAAALRSGRRIEQRPSSFLEVVGFRVARTCPPR